MAQLLITHHVDCSAGKMGYQLVCSISSILSPLVTVSRAMPPWVTTPNNNNYYLWVKHLFLPFFRTKKRNINLTKHTRYTVVTNEYSYILPKRHLNNHNYSNICLFRKAFQLVVVQFLSYTEPHFKLKLCKNEKSCSILLSSLAVSTFVPN